MSNQHQNAEISQAWLCLRFTHLALNSAGIAVNASKAAAITHQQQIWQYNREAEKSAIRLHMSTNHALMLCSDLETRERDTILEIKKLQKLAYWAYRFTSLVSIYNDHTLLLEIGKSIKLFNNLNHLIHLIHNDLNSFQMQTEMGVGATPKAAYAMSFNTTVGLETTSTKDTNRDLQNTAIAHLDIDDKTIDQLHHCGFEVLGDITHIAYAELGSRFGAPLLDYLDKLYGRKADPQIATTPPEHFHVSADFSEPISNVSWIQQQLERLLADLVHFTALRQMICRSFTWRFYQENNRLLETITIGLSARQGLFPEDKQLMTFLELTELKLANLELEWEFSSIELSSTQLVPIQLFNDDLFNPQPCHTVFNQLIDKLSSRLGNNALFRMHPEPEHLPELANGRRYAAQENSADSLPDKSDETSFKDQPLWLLETPKPLAQRQTQPLFEGPLTIIHGPDRISSHWWAKLQSRDYFIARQRNGRLLWIFFDRGNRNWYLHGMFA